MSLDVALPSTVRGVIFLLLIVAVVILMFYVSPMAVIVGAIFLVLLAFILYALGMNVFRRAGGF